MEEQQELINDCTTAKEAWDTLFRLFGQSSAVMVNKLLDDLNDLKKESKEEVTHYIARAKAIARSIRASGESCSDRIVINRLLAGLPKEYEVVRSTLALNRDLTLEFLTSSLLDAQARISRDKRRSASPPPAPAPRNDIRPSEQYRSREDPNQQYRFREDPNVSFRRWCSHCGKTGHSINAC